MRFSSLLKVINPTTREAFLELRRLRKLPRRQPTRSNLLGFPLEIPDAASFLAMRHEIFERGIYQFRSSSDSPRIIDGGANIGLGVIYFKRMWPHSQVIAFEPDPYIYSVLQKNVEHNNCAGVELVKKALWSSSTMLHWAPDNADAGRVVEDGSNSVQVPAVRLRDYLQEPTDLLKLDIEGAEWEVLRDCADYLTNVRNAFVECHSFTNKPQNLHSILTLLHERGFRYFVEPVSTALQPFVERPNYMGMDMQVNVYASRE